MIFSHNLSPGTAHRMMRWLAKSTTGILVMLVTVGLSVPLYSDEVGWRLQERAGFDGVDKLYSEQCGPATMAVPPWFMWPVRWYSAVFNSAWPDPFAVRLSGVIYALAWVMIVLMLIHRIASDGQRRNMVMVLCCGLMGLGVMPWLLVWSRPEQPIILAATASMLIACTAPRLVPATMPGRRWAPVAILMLGTIALSYHFKALVLVPLFIAAMIAAAPVRRTWVIQGLCTLALLGVAVVSARYWFTRMACPGDPVVAAQHATQNLGLQLLTSGGWAMAPLRLLANYQLPVYLAQAAPDITPMSDWLRPNLVGKQTQIAWTIALVALWMAGFVLAVSVVAAALWARRMNRPLWLAGVTLACVSAWCMTQLVRNTYEASFVLPLLTLAFALALSPGALPDRTLAALRRVATAVGLALPVSAIAILAMYGPSLANVAGKGGYLPGQPYSVGLAHYDTLRRQILLAAAACGIVPQNHPKRLLLDDVTYFTFMDAPLPDNRISVLEPQWRGNLKDPLAYLRLRQSSGVVLACSALSPELRAIAHATGAICCIAPDQWQISANRPAMKNPQ